MSKLTAPDPSVSSSAQSAEASDVRVLQHHLLKHSAAGAEVVSQVLAFALQRSGALAVLLFRQVAGGEGLEVEAHLAAEGKLPDRVFELAARSCSLQALKADHVHTAHVARSGGAAMILSCPARVASAPERALAVVLNSDSKDSAVSVVFLQWMADVLRNHFAEEARTRQASRTETALQHSTALVELITRTSSAEDFPQAVHMLVNEVRSWLPCDQVVLARYRFGRCRVVAFSGTTDSSKRSDAHATAELVLRAAIQQRREISSFSEESPAPLVRSPFSDELERVFGVRQFLAAPLISPGGVVRGAWLFLWRGGEVPSPAKERFVQVASEHVASHLALLAHGKPGSFRGGAMRLWKKATVNQRRAVATGFALFCLLLLWPVSYRVKASCEIQPVVRRVVAAPFDALLRKAFAQAGQTVNEGQLLAEMEGKEIRWQLAESVAKYVRAVKQGEKATTEGDIAAARMAELEAASLAEERKLLEYRRDHLEVRSPIAGVVISGDLERAEGVPLKTGEPLYEIAPLEQMLVEVLVDEEDITLVAPGLSVDVRLDSEPGRVWTAKIRRIDPRAELRDTRNVFVCEALLNNEAQRLHPGMKGRAKVYAARRPLVWMATRRAWNYLRMTLW